MERKFQCLEFCTRVGTKVDTARLSWSEGGGTELEVEGVEEPPGACGSGQMMCSPLGTV